MLPRVFGVSRFLSYTFFIHICELPKRDHLSVPVPPAPIAVAIIPDHVIGSPNFFAAKASARSIISSASRGPIAFLMSIAPVRFLSSRPPPARGRTGFAAGSYRSGISAKKNSGELRWVSARGAPLSANSRMKDLFKRAPLGCVAKDYRPKGVAIQVARL